MRIKTIINAIILVLLACFITACGAGSQSESGLDNGSQATDTGDSNTNDTLIDGATYSSITAPLLSSVPSAGANNVLRDAKVELTFVDNVALDKFAKENIKVLVNGAEASGQIIIENSKLIFAPTEPFKYDSQVVISIANIFDKAGKRINQIIGLSFKVEAEPDTTAPSLVSYTPLDGADDVAINSQIIIAVDEELNVEACSPAIALYSQDNENAAGSFELKEDKKGFSFISSSNLLYKTTYTFEASNLCDKAKNELYIKLSFTTADAPDLTPPAKVTLSLVDAARAKLVWHAPGDDGIEGQAVKYVMKISSHPIETDVDFDDAMQITGLPSPAEAGQEENFVVPGLGINEKHYVALRTYDDAGNASEIASTEINTAAEATFLVEELAKAALNDSFGYTVAGNCDVNGDGYSDVIIGEHLDDVAGVDTGKVHVYFGSNEAVGIDSGELNGGRLADLVINGIDSHASSNDDYLGYSIACDLDFNGDGIDDILIGAPREDTKNGSIYSGNSGAAYLFYGKDFGEIELAASDADVIFQGVLASDFFGWTVTSLGDLNNDGKTDVGISAPYAEAIEDAEGIVYIFYGSNLEHGSIVYDFSTNIKIAGTKSVQGLGLNGVVNSADIDGDNLNDIIITMSSATLNYQGAVYVFLGKNGLPAYIDMSLHSADITIIGDTEKDYFGGTISYKPSVSASGDINNDGINDLVIGAYQDDIVLSTNGAVYIFYGREEWPATLVSTTDADVVISGASANDYFGVAVDTNGDYNNDGINDILVSAQKYVLGLNRGGAFVFFGHEDLAESINMLDADVIIAAPAATFRDIGLANIINTNDYLGSSLSFAGDVDGDGYDDILLGAYGNEVGGRASSAGSAYVIH